MNSIEIPLSCPPDNPKLYHKNRYCFGLGMDILGGWGLPKETPGRGLHFGNGHLAQSRFWATLVSDYVQIFVISNATSVFVKSGLRTKPDPYQQVGLDLKFLVVPLIPQNLGSRTQTGIFSNQLQKYKYLRAHFVFGFCLIWELGGSRYVKNAVLEHGNISHYRDLILRTSLFFYFVESLEGMGGV